MLRLDFKALVGGSATYKLLTGAWLLSVVIRAGKRNVMTALFNGTTKTSILSGAEVCEYSSPFKVNSS